LANAESYIKELESLDMWVHTLFAQVPEEERIVVTTHDAFWYFGNAYAITFMSPIGISTEAQASAADVAKIIDVIRDHQVKAVFVENLANPGLIHQIASEAKVKVDGTLYADSLSASHEAANTYVGMIKHNALTIFKALMGETQQDK
jgi:zinc/manganese transport system substrate-binding protein